MCGGDYYPLNNQKASAPASNPSSIICATQAVLLYYWRRAARIAPAHWASLLLAYCGMLRGREHVSVPEATGALLHYPPASCPRERPASIRCRMEKPHAPVPVPSRSSSVPALGSHRYLEQCRLMAMSEYVTSRSWAALVCWQPDHACRLAGRCRGAVGAGCLPGALAVWRRLQPAAVVAGG
jgi:hypothetical protein